MSRQKFPVTQNPLVTYIVVAYNQEQLVREAVQSAFAQNYTPLEIILSDDCSSDRTFDIMQELALNYEGRHSVKVVQNSENLGLFDHIICRGKQASGEIAILAAGDDISVPERTTKTVEAFNEGTGAAFSLVSIINGKGTVLADAVERPLHLRRPKLPLLPRNNSYDVIQGCSAAYRRWVFDIPVSSRGKRYPEDLIFSFYLHLLGSTVRRVDLPLVGYRAHADALTNIPEDCAQVVDEERRCRVAVGSLQLLSDYRAIADVLGKWDMVDFKIVRQREVCLRDILDWPGLPFRKRLWRTFTMGAGFGWVPFRWKLVRLWGRYPNYQPRKFISSMK